MINLDCTFTCNRTELEVGKSCIIYTMYLCKSPAHFLYGLLQMGWDVVCCILHTVQTPATRMLNQGGNMVDVAMAENKLCTGIIRRKLKSL